MNLKAQELEHSKKNIDTLLTIVKKYTSSKNNSEITVADKNLEEVKRMIYKSYAESPIEFEKMFHKWVEDWKSTAISGIKDPIGEKPGVRLKRVEEALAKKYGWDYVRFLETPYILKVNILSKDVTVYESFNQDEISLPQVDLTVKIEEIIKGSKTFTEGEEIKISYLPIWYSDCDCPVDFSVGSTYLIPLRPWYFKHHKNTKDLMIKNNGMEHFYKIENNTVTKPFIASSSFSESWQTFKKAFTNKYILMEDK
ncbi:MAG: hypothetical protein ACE5ES_05580 [Candidatus Nanoarchaeia archaeon]